MRQYHFDTYAYPHWVTVLQRRICVLSDNWRRVLYDRFVFDKQVEA